MTDFPRLIEFAFPLKQTSLDPVHEKNVRDAAISTLHMARAAAGGLPLKEGVKMLLPHDYASAAARHWEDAISLTQASRFDNSAYLAGYVVECSLKSLIEISGGLAKALST